MIKLITIFLITLSFNSHAFFRLNCSVEGEKGRLIEGVISDVFIGEVDNEVIGEACVVFVKTRSHTLAIVENIVDCDLASKYIDFIGDKISECITRLKKIRSYEELCVLKEFDAKAYYLEKEND